MDPYYSDASTTIYLGDCREVIPALNLRADLVLADPPYGDTSLSWDRWSPGWLDVTSESAPQMWCFGSMRMWFTRGSEFTDALWTYAQEIVWEKHNGSGFHADRFKRVHEFAMHFYRGQWRDLTINPQVSTGHERKTIKKRPDSPAHTGTIGADRGYDTTDRLLRSVLYVASMHGAAIHPTEKPVGILTPLIAYSTNPGDLILDPFAGSCSTARAARALGRRSICIEANEEYLEAAVKALAQGDLFAEATP